MRRTITSMKIINDYNFYYYHYESMSVGLSIYLPKLDKFYASIVLFYHRLTLLAEDNFYEDS
ncbi:hypothetical protein [Microcystis phage LMM01]|uniref:Uncharacterized protein n=1 Tax=Microcystis phage LMM01 TaxID=2856824 RepID=A0A7S0_9CAUD|nr:hypothetical protein MaLMM01_gp156 [Microcystis phage LMM01]BAF36247.1 hypothetical protein [Microcystis phage LMM01]